MIARRVLVWASMLAAGTALAQAGADFSADEWQRLRRGELVMRPREFHEGGFRYYGGTSWQRVRASREEVWRQVLNTQNYPRFIPAVDQARLLDERGDRRLIYLRHHVSLATASYYAHVRIDRPQHTIHFQLDRSRPHDVRAGRGFIRVDRFGGDSLVTWGVRADPGGGMLGGLLGPMLQQWVLRVPWCIRGYIEPSRPRC
jgi:carbon monoxide dehydrogenase subunit G